MLTEEWLDDAQREQKRLIISYLESSAVHIEETRAKFVLVVIKKSNIEELAAPNSIEPYCKHLHQEVKELKSHRCLSTLRDAANSAGKLVRFAEKARNRALKTDEKKGGKKVEVADGADQFVH